MIMSDNLSQINLDSLGEDQETSSLLQFSTGQHLEKSKLLLTNLDYWVSTNKHKIAQIFSPETLTEVAKIQSQKILVESRDSDLYFPSHIYSEISEIEIDREEIDDDTYLTPVTNMNKDIIINSYCLTCSEISPKCTCETSAANWITADKLLNATKAVATQARHNLDSHSNSSNISPEDIPVQVMPGSSNLLANMMSKKGKSLLQDNPTQNKGRSLLEDKMNDLIPRDREVNPILPISTGAIKKVFTPSVGKSMLTEDTSVVKPQLSIEISSDQAKDGESFISISSDQEDRDDYQSNIEDDIPKPILKGVVSHVGKVDNDYLTKCANSHFTTTMENLKTLQAMGKTTDGEKVPIKDRDTNFLNQPNISQIESAFIDKLLISQSMNTLVNIQNSILIIINNQSSLDATLRLLKGEIFSIKNQIKQLNQKSSVKQEYSGRSRSRSRSRHYQKNNYQDNIVSEASTSVKVPSWKKKGTQKVSGKPASQGILDKKTALNKVESQRNELASLDKIYQDALKKYNITKKIPVAIGAMKRILKEWKKFDKGINTIDIETFENSSIEDILATMEDCYNLLYSN